MFNQYWDTWKKGFGAWEKATASYLEAVVKNPVTLGGAGSLLSSAMKTKSATDKALETAAKLLSLGTTDELLAQLGSAELAARDVVAALYPTAREGGEIDASRAVVGLDPGQRIVAGVALNEAHVVQPGGARALARAIQHLFGVVQRDHPVEPLREGSLHHA